MILLLDNYDSFTYNIEQYLRQLGVAVCVYKNDELTLASINHMQPQAIVLGPGPGTPDEAGITLAVIAHFAGKVPMLGVCLGHQAIAQAFGAQVVRAEQIMHGRTSSVYHDDSGVFHSIASPTTVTRYHSLLVDKNTLPNNLKITAWTRQSGPKFCAYNKVTKDNIAPKKVTTKEDCLQIKNTIMTNNGTNPMVNDKRASNMISSSQKDDSTIYEIMGIRHIDLPIEGVQFHPESILSASGQQIFKNFLINHNLLEN